MKMKMKNQGFLLRSDLLRINKLNTLVFFSYYYYAYNYIKKFRLLLIKLENRIAELQKDITYSKLRYKLYDRLNSYKDMNKKVYICYHNALKKIKLKIKLKQLDLDDVPDDYLQYIRKNIYMAWEIIKFFKKNDKPYSILLRKKKSFNVFDKSLVLFLEVIFLGFDLNKLRFKIKKLMDKLSMLISIYLRERVERIERRERRF
jgi:hypothetical protein